METFEVVKSNDAIRLGTLYEELGHTLSVAGRYDDALECLNHVLDCYSESIGPLHFRNGPALGAIAMCHQRKGDLVRAK